MRFSRSVIVIVVALVVLIFIAILGSAAQAQSQRCAPRDIVVAALAEKFGETRQMAGLDARGRITEIWANLETGTWSATETHANGLTCLVASGEDFERLALEPVGMRL